MFFMQRANDVRDITQSDLVRPAIESALLGLVEVSKEPVAGRGSTRIEQSWKRRLASILVLGMQCIHCFHKRTHLVALSPPDLRRQRVALRNFVFQIRLVSRRPDLGLSLIHI